MRGWGSERAERYWAIFEGLRTELGYADYLSTLQHYRVERPYDSHLLAVLTYLVDYSFANRLFPNSLDALEDAVPICPTVSEFIPPMTGEMRPAE